MKIEKDKGVLLLSIGVDRIQDYAYNLSEINSKFKCIDVFIDKFIFTYLAIDPSDYDIYTMINSTYFYKGTVLYTEYTVRYSQSYDNEIIKFVVKYDENVSEYSNDNGAMSLDNIVNAYDECGIYYTSKDTTNKRKDIWWELKDITM